MGSHFHDWIDYNGVAFSIVLLEWGRTFSDFWGKTVLQIYGYKGWLPQFQERARTSRNSCCPASNLESWEACKSGVFYSAFKLTESWSESQKFWFQGIYLCVVLFLEMFFDHVSQVRNSIPLSRKKSFYVLIFTIHLHIWIEISLRRHVAGFQKKKNM